MYHTCPSALPDSYTASTCGCCKRPERDLPQETLYAERGGQLGVERLERHPAVVRQVAREIDGSHTALSELALEHEAVAEGIGEKQVEARHRVRGNGLNVLRGAPERQQTGHERRLSGA